MTDRLYLFNPIPADRFLQGHALVHGDIVQIAKRIPEAKGLPPKYRYAKRECTWACELVNKESLIPISDFKNNVNHYKWVYFSLNDRSESPRMFRFNVHPDSNWISIDIFADAQYANGEFVFKSRDELDKFLNCVGDFIRKFTDNFIFRVEYLKKRNMKAGRPF